MSISSQDQLVYEMSSMTAVDPMPFIRKDWLSILDNQNGNYSSNQAVIDTSQISNSNKYLNFREAYLSIPMLLTLTSNLQTTGLLADLQNNPKRIKDIDHSKVLMLT